LEDWREKCWDHRYPRHYGKKSLPFIGLLFGINPSDIIAIDDKPQIWTNMSQVIYAVPYTGGIYLKQENSNDDINSNTNSDVNDNSNDNHISKSTLQQNCMSNQHSSKQINDVLFKIAKYLESYLYHTLGVLSKQRRLSEQYNKNKHLKLQLHLSNPTVSHSKKQIQNKNEHKHTKNDEKNHDTVDAKKKKKFYINLLNVYYFL